MKKIFLLLFLFCVSKKVVSAQVPSQAELDKLLKQTEDMIKKYGGDSTVKKALKNAEEQQKQVTGAIKNSPNKPTVSSYTDAGAYGNADNWKFPKKNTALLASLPKRIFTKAELVSFLNDLYNQLSKKLPPGTSASVQAMGAKYNNDGNKMGDAAIMGWYSSHPEEAILLIVKSAAINPDNEILLNNCAALLNMSGIEQKAIPILKYVLQSYPNNSMLLNNLGQAYTGLGELDTAMIYFGRCLQNTPEHAEACGTVGFIEESRGHIEKAIEYFEKSIKSAYSKTVDVKLRKLKKGRRLVDLVRPRIKLPEYFNLFKYDLPAQCMNISNTVLAEAEHTAFRKMLTQQMQKYGAMYQELAQKQMQKGLAIMNAGGVSRKLNPNEFMAQPFYELCQIMAGQVLEDYKKELGDFHNKTIKTFSTDIASLEKEYDQKYKEAMDKLSEDASEEEVCAAKNEVANTYLPKFAYLTQEMQDKGKRIFRTYFDELVYWHYLSLNPLSQDQFKMQYYYFIQQYLSTMAGICQTRIIKPCDFKPVTLSKESNDIKEMECPLDFAIALIVGSIELNCSELTISGGEALIFEYVGNFKTRESTMNIGIGAKLHLGKNFNVGVEQYAFIKFDGNGRYADAGMEMKAGIEATLGTIDNGKKPMVGVKAEVGYAIGLESGITFDEGPYKKLFSTETPLNKNIKIYKPD